MYFCTHCKRNHRSGKIYQKHLEFKELEENNIPCNKVIDCIWEDLPGIAKRQIRHYIRKMTWDSKNNFSKKRKMYIGEINRVILEEDNDMIRL